MTTWLKFIYEQIRYEAMLRRLVTIRRYEGTWTGLEGPAFPLQDGRYAYLFAIQETEDGRKWEGPHII